MDIPEILLLKIVSGLIDHVRADTQNGSIRKEETILWQYFKDTKIGDFDYYEQAVHMFSRPKGDPRYLDVRPYFDTERAGIPTIHITMPSSQPKGDGLGFDEGYEEHNMHEADSSYSKILTRGFTTQHQMIVTSDNYSETSLLYHLLMGLLISAMTSVQFAGLQNPSLGGQDLQIRTELVPKNIFYKAVTLTSFHEISVPVLFTKKIITDLIFNSPKPVNPT